MTKAVDEKILSKEDARLLILSLILLESEIPLDWKGKNGS